MADLGAKYWHNPGAFANGFNGFAGVFVVAAFAFGGTELVGLAAAEATNPLKSVPKATKQVFWRIAFFYIVNLFILGLIIPYTDDRLLSASGANTKSSPFVLAIQDAGIQVLPSIFNVVITLSVISVANSCTFGSTRTMQALGERGMGPKFLAYVDKSGRPLWCVLIQIMFGFLAFIGESGKSKTVFNWLLALTGLSFFFVWGSICLTHIRFRYAWKAHGYSLDQIPYKPSLGVIGSWIGLVLNILCLMATFYNALYVSRPPAPSPCCDGKMQSEKRAEQRFPALAQRSTGRQRLLPGLLGSADRHCALCVLQGLHPRLAHVHSRPRDRSQDGNEAARAGGRGPTAPGEDVGEPTDAHGSRAHLSLGPSASTEPHVWLLRGHCETMTRSLVRIVFPC